MRRLRYGIFITCVSILLTVGLLGTTFYLGTYFFGYSPDGELDDIRPNAGVIGLVCLFCMLIPGLIAAARLHRD
jgi:hypothetical protein